MADRLVVVGGDAGGMTAALQARRRQPYLEIVALEKGAWTSYSACGIPYLVGGDVASIDDLVARTPQDHREKHRIDVRLHHEVTENDLAARRLELRDTQRTRTIQLGFDQLHIPTGARTTSPHPPDTDAETTPALQPPRHPHAPPP